MKFADLAYARPATLSEALELLAEHEEAAPLAGGQSLLTVMSFRLAAPDLLINIANLPELTGFEETGTELRIGAAMRHAWIEDGALPGPLGAFLAKAAGNIGYRAIRNRGTIGGSLAHADPAADWPTVLTALGAELELASAAGRRRLPLDDFLEGEMTTALEPGELIAAVWVPKRPAAGYGVHKIARKSGEFANAIAAAEITPERSHIAVGLVAGKPLALEIDNIGTEIDLSGRLTGTPLYQTLLPRIAAEAPDAEPYSIHLAVIAALHALAAADTTQRVEA